MTNSDKELLRGAEDELAWLKSTREDKEDALRIIGYEDCLNKIKAELNTRHTPALDESELVEKLASSLVQNRESKLPRGEKPHNGVQYHHYVDYDILAKAALDYLRPRMGGESEKLRDPHIDVYDAARGFLLFMGTRKSGSFTFENAKEHAVMYGDDWPKWLEGRTGHITKSEQAEIIYRLCVEQALKQLSKGS